MITIAKQTISTKSGPLTVELLKHDQLDKFYVYSSDDLAVTDMLNAQQAINVYSSYAAIAVSSLFIDPSRDLYKDDMGECCF